MLVTIIDKENSIIADKITPSKVWVSPDKCYAIVGVLSESFVAGKIINSDENDDYITLQCVKELCTETDEVDLHIYRVDWSNMEYGFCKLNSWGLESNKTRTFRIYFDFELYKKKYEEINGVPYQGEEK